MQVRAEYAESRAAVADAELAQLHSVSHSTEVQMFSLLHLLLKFRMYGDFDRVSSGQNPFVVGECYTWAGKAKVGVLEGGLFFTG